MEFVQGVIVAVRTIKAELGISPTRRVRLLLHPVDEAQCALLERNRVCLETLARLEELVIDAAVPAPSAAASAVTGGCQVIVPLAGSVDLADELARLDKELAKLEKDMTDVNRKLHNESFVSRAPAEVVARERQRAATLTDARDKLASRRALFAEALKEDRHP